MTVTNYADYLDLTELVHESLNVKLPGTVFDVTMYDAEPRPAVYVNVIPTIDPEYSLAFDVDTDGRWGFTQPGRKRVPSLFDHTDPMTVIVDWVTKVVTRVVDPTYLNHDICPRCSSGDTSDDRIEYTAPDTAETNATCHHCHATWVNVYTLTRQVHQNPGTR